MEFEFSVYQDLDHSDPVYRAEWDAFVASCEVKNISPWGGAPGAPRPPKRDMWIVSLPHQCDRWEIACAPHAEAVATMQRFIAEAQQALAALQAREEIEDE